MSAHSTATSTLPMQDGSDAADEDQRPPNHGTALLQGLLGRRPARPLSFEPRHGVTVGELIGLRDGAVGPLVRYAGQPGTAALAARTTVALLPGHVGRALVLAFEQGDPMRPIVMGLVHDQAADTASALAAAQVDVDADGTRMTIAAREQLVLRCGKASITLTQAGKVLIRGHYVSSTAEGMNRIRGGAIQLN